MSPAPMPIDGTTLPQPYTLTSDVDNLGSIASAFLSKTDMSSPPVPTAALTPDQISSMSAMQASFLSAVTAGAKTATSGGQSAAQTTLTTSTTPTQNTSPGEASKPSKSSRSDSALTTNSNSATQSVNTSTTGTSGAVTTSIASSHTSAAGATVATSAANTSANVQKDESTMSSPGMQAAVAVPIVVVVVLAVVALIFFCMRRRRKRADPPHEVAEKTPIVGSKKPNWTRHLRVFSFDNELLMGGRYSSTNSLRSRQTPSLRGSARTNTNGADSPSVHSVEEVAPPYRDAIRSGPTPNIAAIMAGGAAGATAATALNRSASGATAPPSYKSPLSRTVTPASAASSIRDPFADNQSPVSSSEGSPFNDPEGATPPVSRGTSIYTHERDDASSVGDAASIRQAQIARNPSIMTTGTGPRIVETARRAS